METKEIPATIVVTNKTKALAFSSEEPWAAISVSTMKGDFPLLRVENCEGVLRLCFWDLPDPTPDQIAKHPTRYFSDVHVKQVLDFATEMMPKVKTLLVHCEAGLSRSPAIAAALHHMYYGDGADSYFKIYMPNQFVFKKLLEGKYGKEEMAKIFTKIVPKDEIYETPWDCKE